MNEHLRNFHLASEEKAFDLDHRRKILGNISRYDHTVLQGKRQYADLEHARCLASQAKHRAIENLDKYLEEFERNFSARGGKVLWARNGEEACGLIASVFEENGVRSVVKGKSMTTEEIHFNEAMQKRGFEAVETDLGEFIVQLAGEAPYHIVTPAMHKSKEDVASLMHERLGMPPGSKPEEITIFVRKTLRKKFTSAEAGVTGANFLIADSGAVAVTENEGNALLSASLPGIHIAVAGIEKIIPSLTELDLFWSLLSTHGTGQYLTVYNTLFCGPRQKGERDGPEKMYVVLLDNGRSDLLSETRQRSALGCIRCGACLNACPVYRTVGGHTYAATYSGPIGSVITPHYNGMRDFIHLSYASSLCGRCSEVCPVKIDIHKLLLYNRRSAVERKILPGKERLAVWLWKNAMLYQKTLNFTPVRLKQIVLRWLFRKGWGRRRTLPTAARRTFGQLVRSDVKLKSLLLPDQKKSKHE